MITVAAENKKRDATKSLYKIKDKILNELNLTIQNREQNSTKLIVKEEKRQLRNK